MDRISKNPFFDKSLLFEQEKVALPASEFLSTFIGNLLVKSKPNLHYRIFQKVHPKKMKPELFKKKMAKIY